MILNKSKTLKNLKTQRRTFSSRNQNICFDFRDIPDISEIDFSCSWHLRRLLEWERSRIWTARRNIENANEELSKFLFKGIENGIQFGEITDVLLLIERIWAILLYDGEWGRLIRSCGIDEKILERGSFLCQKVIEENLKEKSRFLRSSPVW